MHPPRPTTIRVAAVLAATIAVMAALPAFAAQFIEQSRVIYPKAIGALKLDRVSYDEENPFAGVTFVYAIALRPGTTLYARVQPAGRLPEAEAMQAGVARTHEDLRAEYATGNYNDVQVQPDRKIDLQASETVVLHGRLLSHSFTQGAVRFEARTLLLYRYDYWLILRLTAGGLDASEADQAIVGAAADLVPELRIANRGDCSLNPASIQEQVAVGHLPDVLDAVLRRHAPGLREFKGGLAGGNQVLAHRLLDEAELVQVHISARSVDRRDYSTRG